MGGTIGGAPFQAHIDNATIRAESQTSEAIVIPHPWLRVGSPSHLPHREADYGAVHQMLLQEMDPQAQADFLMRFESYSNDEVKEKLDLYRHAPLQTRANAMIGSFAGWSDLRTFLSGLRLSLMSRIITKHTFRQYTPHRQVCSISWNASGCLLSVRCSKMQSIAMLGSLGWARL